MTNTTTFVDRNNRLANTFAAANWGSSRPEGCVPIRSFSASVNMNKFEAYPVGDQHSDNREAETKFLQHVDGFPQTFLMSWKMPTVSRLRSSVGTAGVNVIGPYKIALLSFLSLEETLLKGPGNNSAKIGKQN